MKKAVVRIIYNSEKFVTGESFERLKEALILFGSENGIDENLFEIENFKIDYNKK